MTPTRFKEIRLDLGLSHKEMAEALGFEGSRIIYYYESGDRAVSGPVAKLMLRLKGDQKHQ